jgi:class 3 adenylate cyclase/tetratricopeptide (TPR) repeat protein
VAARFCPQCGNALSAPADAQAGGAPDRAIAPATADAERRQLTVMFCDLVGSTALSGRLDPEELRDVVRAYQAACAEVVDHFDGHIAQYLGDGLLVYFGFPAAHEDDAQRAVAAGLGIVEAIRPLGLTARVGIHTGSVVVGEVGAGTRQERLALGETPNLAARLEAAAEPNTVLISAATHRLVKDGFTCRELGARAFKGIDNPVPVYEVLAGAPVRSRLDAVHFPALTDLVGREQELGLLLGRWARAREGAGQVVLLSGEAGIGKSRLIQVLRERLASEPHTRLECRCSSYHQNSPFRSLIELLQGAFGFNPDDSDESRLAKLETGLAPFIASLPDAVSLYAALLSIRLGERYPPLAMTPQRQKEQTVETVLGVLLAMASREPVLFVVEDLHWADPSMLELLDLLVEQAPTARLLVVLTFRPEFRPAWPGRSHLAQVTLDRLGPSQTELMVTSVAGGKRLPAELARELVTRTDGVPLFIEELTKTVLESGLVRETGGAWELDQPLPPFAIPSSLQDSLMARLDRLGETRSVAQLAATLGREFRYEVLKSVSDLDDATLLAGLAKLIEAELVYQRGLPPRASYMFKHALIQEAAYTSLLKSTRQQRHQHIALVLEREFPEIRDTQPEVLAHHYTQAGLAPDAIAWWRRAALAAMQRWANVEAVAHLDRALELLPALPNERERLRQELALRMSLATAWTMIRGWAASEVEAAWQRALQLSEDVGDSSEIAGALFGLWAFYLVRGDHRLAIESARRFVAFAGAARDRKILMDAHRAMGMTSMLVGDFRAAHAHLTEALARYDPALDGSDALLYGHDAAVMCWSYTTLVRWITGYPDQAVEAQREALAVATGIAHPFVTAFAFHSAAWLSLLRRDRDALEWARRLVTLSSEQRFVIWTYFGGTVLGRLLCDEGRAEDGLAEAERSLAIGDAIGVGINRPYLLGLLAEIQARLGRVGDGFTTTTKALALVDELRECMCKAELLRIRGELLLGQAPSDEMGAEAVFRRAIDVARSQQAKSWELRAATSLARLLARQDRREEARSILAATYAWFTEGFDTGDLREAKLLLDAL